MGLIAANQFSPSQLSGLERHGPTKMPELGRLILYLFVASGHRPCRDRDWSTGRIL